MTITKYTAALSIGMLALSGCATITRGTSEALQIQTTPGGATATINGMSCSTPCAMKQKRKSELDVHIVKEGYKPVDVHVTHEVAGAGAAGMAGNVLLGGIIGAGVDAASGAMNRLVPNPVIVTLESEQPDQHVSTEAAATTSSTKTGN